MRSSVLHSVIIILLAVIYIGEGILPCAEVLYAHCGEEQDCSFLAGDYQHSHEDHHYGEDHTEQCHTDHCGCPCHMACVECCIYAPVVVEYTTLSYPTPDCSSPINIPLFPDHIPIA